MSTGDHSVPLAPGKSVIEFGDIGWFRENHFSHSRHSASVQYVVDGDSEIKRIHGTGPGLPIDYQYYGLRFLCGEARGLSASCLEVIVCFTTDYLDIVDRQRGRVGYITYRHRRIEKNTRTDIESRETLSITHTGMPVKIISLSLTVSVEELCIHYGFRYL